MRRYMIMKQFKELAHIAVLTKDMEASIAFYGRSLRAARQRA